MGIYDKRVAFKPFEYPEVLEYKKAINHSYWLVSDWNFLGDIHDYNVSVSDKEKTTLKHAILAISQIEVSIKKFWTKLGDRFPKSEFEQVGITFGESEVRHSDAYSHLLEVLGLNNEFVNLINEPVIQGRIEYLSKYLKGAFECTNEHYSSTLALFSLFIENVSLFSQFLVIRSFNQHKNIFKDIDNIVQATQKEETIHALFGMYLINKIKEEHPDWFQEEFYENLKNACLKAYEAEANIIDWIFRDGDLDFLTKEEVKEFIKKRFNDSMLMIGGKEVFEVDYEKLKNLKWFDVEILAEVNLDFFYKKPVTYSKKVQSFTPEDLF